MKNLFLRTLNTVYIIIHSFVFIGVSLVLEYSDESKIFKIFSKKNRLLIGNCVSLSGLKEKHLHMSDTFHLFLLEL